MRNGKTIPVRKILAVLLAVPFVFLVGLPYAQADVGGVEDSYHGQLGRGEDLDGWGNGLGMLEKWCALPNFSFSKQGQVDGWTTQSCNGCHIGAAWNPTKEVADCTRCHESTTGGDDPTIAKCYTCHFKDTAKRGDVFDDENDVHIAAGMLCQDCHKKVMDTDSDHQFLKGTAIDTTEDTMEGTLKCANCHGQRPHRHRVRCGSKLDKHCYNVACETCHTGLRPGNALLSRDWDTFTAAGKPVTKKRGTGWLPEHKWYDNTGPQESGDFHLPILSYTERRGLPGAKIYPFNPVAVTWFIETSESHLDDVIIVPDVKAAGFNPPDDLVTTVEEMQDFGYTDATLVTRDMNFNVSHSVVPKEEAFTCDDCHGDTGWVLNWEQLGYDGDPADHHGGGGGM